MTKLTPADVAQALDCTKVDAAKLLIRDADTQNKARLARLAADLETLRREEANRKQAAAMAATVRTTEQPSDDTDVAFLHLSHRAVALTEATASGPAVVLSNLGVSYLPVETFRALPATWTLRHSRELRERSLLVVFDVLTSDPLAAILKAIKSPLQDGGGRERTDYECSNDSVVTAQHLNDLLRATRDRGQLERWLDAAGDAQHAGAIRSRLDALFGGGSRDGVGFTTRAHSVGLKGI